jgi:hypothetical protein
LLGFSSIANVLMSIKYAKYYELDENDIVLTVFTDSMELYGSRLREMHEEVGEYTEMDAARDHARYLEGVTPNYLLDLNHEARRRIHNLKYYTWIEQQGKELKELNAQWEDDSYWDGYHQQIDEMDELIEDFNDRVGLL